MQERGGHDERCGAALCARSRRSAGKKADEIRRMFNIKNDFTPEEEEQVRKENEWCETTP